jgi:predicted Rossmann fold flavoprotein
VILATGGKSYPLTGSDGSGYKLAKKLGHNLVEPKASIIPLLADSGICQSMQGLSLKNVKISIKNIENNKMIYDDFGEMLFTHFGVSGPTILSSSAHLVRLKDVNRLFNEGKLKLYIDLKPALSDEELDARILRDFEEFKNKEFKNSLVKLLPQKMIETVISISKINPEKRVNEITKEERRNLVKILKNFEVTLRGFRPVEEAIITAGGISVKDINPKTMESKLVKGLYFAGEIIDVDAYTGGFNLQIAYSTGFTAGLN